MRGSVLFAAGVAAGLAAFLALATATACCASAAQPASESSECRGLRKAGIIPPGAPALVMGFPARPGTFLCLAGRARAGLRTRFVLHPWFEDEPRLVAVLGGPGEPVGCMTDAECELAAGPGAAAGEVVALTE